MSRADGTLTHLYAKLSNNYPTRAEVITLAHKAQEAIGALRCELEEVMLAADFFPDTQDMSFTHIYYGDEPSPFARIPPPGLPRRGPRPA